MRPRDPGSELRPLADAIFGAHKRVLLYSETVADPKLRAMLELVSAQLDQIATSLHFICHQMSTTNKGGTDE